MMVLRAASAGYGSYGRVAMMCSEAQQAWLLWQVQCLI